jgi:hypothetical protein
MRIPDNIPPEMLVENTNNDMLLFTAILSFLIGIFLTWLGRHGKQLWLFVWSIGLVICSVLLGGYMLLYAP